MIKYINFLNSFDKDLNDITLASFIKELTIDNFQKGDIYLYENKTPKEIGFILTGLVRSFLIDENGSEKTINFFKEVNYVGDYHSLICQKPTPYCFQFLEPTTLVRIPYRQLKESLIQIPQLEKHRRMLAEQKLQSQNQRLKLFLTCTAEQRYLSFILNNGDLFSRVLVSHLCTYLGIERQSLTRIRKNMLNNNDTSESG